VRQRGEMSTDILLTKKKPEMDQGVITDLDIQALVDNSDRLTSEERRRLTAIIKNDRALKKRYDDLIRQKELLQAWWDESRRQLH
jgi:hypothetical protein